MCTLKSVEVTSYFILQNKMTQLVKKGWFVGFVAVFVYGVAWMSSSSSSLVLVGDVCEIAPRTFRDLWVLQSGGIYKLSVELSAVLLVWPSYRVLWNFFSQSPSTQERTGLVEGQRRLTVVIVLVNRNWILVPRSLSRNKDIGGAAADLFHRCYSTFYAKLSLNYDPGSIA